MIESLHDKGSRDELAEHCTGMPASQIDRLDAVCRKRIARIFRIRRVRVQKRNRISSVDHNTAAPGGSGPPSAFGRSTQRNATRTMSAFTTVRALIEEPSSSTRLASDWGPRWFAIVAGIPLFASRRATLEPSAPAPIIPMLIDCSY